MKQVLGQHIFSQADRGGEERASFFCGLFSSPPLYPVKVFYPSYPPPHFLAENEKHISQHSLCSPKDLPPSSIRCACQRFSNLGHQVCERARQRESTYVRGYVLSRTKSVTVLPRCMNCLTNRKQIKMLPCSVKCKRLQGLTSQHGLEYFCSTGACIF